LASPSVVLGVSVGAGPALLAAADPRVRERVRAVVSLGGYASAREVLRFWLTGAYEYGGVRGRVVHDPELVRSFVAAHADRLEPARPERTALVLVGLVEHVEGGGGAGWGAARDVLALWRVVYALISA